MTSYIHFEMAQSSALHILPMSPQIKNSLKKTPPCTVLPVEFSANSWKWIGFTVHYAGLQLFFHMFNPYLRGWTPSTQFCLFLGFDWGKLAFGPTRKHLIVLAIFRSTCETMSLHCMACLLPTMDMKIKLPWAPRTMKNKGFGHLKTMLFTIKTSKHVGFGGPWYIYHKLDKIFPFSSQITTRESAETSQGSIFAGPFPH